ncbi:class I SAM-dependent methyltransferase [Dyadobacter chenwenxiniae]|uniref:Class I SAM-dependent methyltransferase n=1 Tax=Dyadobacter chenwenxiniae TaxID=2906456 RepID=A0A9X1PLZ9_9BACT|nr:class I SAM-dependent methyltransferase [Dyadobacter chenwenxiniae]MCF0063832.1 class I SAM-dependent methyltransferase [Dyadobacter chenwenxiniae]UON83509.1 class I SAM-dependent methyltransferase [Dyadobacter chenwenxiniae]
MMNKLSLAFPADAQQNTYVSVQTENDFEFQSVAISMLREMVANGGPGEHDYPAIDEMMQHLYRLRQNGQISQEDIALLQGIFNDEFLRNTIHGYVYRKPLGYAGDYALIDMIYTYDSFEHPAYKNWDRYFHYHAATQAVRNRKAFFKSKLLEKLKGRNSPLNLLNVASGPARDLFELYQIIDPVMLTSTCVDIDSNAVAFASELCRPFANQIHFHRQNVLRFSGAEKYDVIWSAGLFDYFEDRIFILALKRLLTFLKPGGEILIGNFSENNPTRGYMEIFGEWVLIHRSAGELTRLSIAAGVRPENILVEQEPLGINLFLRIRSAIPAQQSTLCMN